VKFQGGDQDNCTCFGRASFSQRREFQKELLDALVEEQRKIGETLILTPFLQFSMSKGIIF
jgi:hypothetical protein